MASANASTAISSAYGIRGSAASAARTSCSVCGVGMLMPDHLAQRPRTVQDAARPAAIARAYGAAPRSGGSRRGLRRRAQAVERLALELATALLSHAERAADLRVALGAAGDQAIAPHEHVAVPL